MSVNKVILVGRLGQKPVLTYTASGQPVVNFSLATSEKWTDKSGKPEHRTEWHKIVVWGKQGEHCHQFLDKGSQVYIEGKIQSREWEDKTGKKNTTTDVVAVQVTFLASKEEQKQEKREDQAERVSIKPTPHAYSPASVRPLFTIPTQDRIITEDDLPF